MQVRVHFHGAIDRRGLPQDHLVLLAGHATVEELLRAIGYAEREIRFVVPMIAGERLSLHHALADGDQVDLLAPAGGG